MLITRLKFSEKKSCENTPNAPIFATSLIFIQDSFSYAFHFCPSLPLKLACVYVAAVPVSFYLSGQTLEILFPFPPLIFRLLSLAWTSGPARWSIDAHLLYLLFALSSFRIKPLPSTNSSNAVSHRWQTNNKMTIILWSDFYGHDCLQTCRDKIRELWGLLAEVREKSVTGFRGYFHFS